MVKSRVVIFGTAVLLALLARTAPSQTSIQSNTDGGLVDTQPSVFTVTGVLVQASQTSARKHIVAKLGASDTTGAFHVFSSNNADLFVVRGDGNVGIGAGSPGSKLDVAGSVNATGLTISGIQNTNTRFQQSNNASTSGLFVVASDYFTNGGYLIFNRQSGTSSYGYIQAGDNNANQRLALNPNGGNVGIGTSAPAQTLHVAGQYAEVEFNNTGASGPSVFLAHSRGTNASPTNVTAGDYAGGLLFAAYAGGYTSAGRIDSVVTATNGSAVDAALLFSPAGIATGGNVEVMRITAAGNVGIGTQTPGVAYKLDVAGNANFSGTVTGGNIKAKYQDVAEWVPATEHLNAGTVVVIDASAPNTVRASTRSYDTRVAGVVSERPGLSLGEAGVSKELIATIGRVRVHVDATAHPIHQGDLLVTSGRPGAAMCSEPITISGRTFHQPGTIIGKALEPLATGTGDILVLLTLQ